MPPELPGTGPGISRPAWRGALLVFGIALVIRILFWWEWTNAGLLNLPVVDALTYDQSARGLLDGSWPGPQPFWQAPLYPTFLAAVYQVFGWDWSAARLVQAVLGALTCAATFLLAHGRLSERWALLAGLTCAAYGPLLYFEGQLLRSTLATLLLVLLALLFQYSWERSKPVPWLWGLLGFGLGWSALCRENALVLGPIAILALLLRRSWNSSVRRLMATGLFVIGCGLVIAPVTVHNGRHDPSPLLISSSGGLNFFIGNNAGAARTENIRPGQEWDELVARPRREAGAQQPSERSAFFYAQAWRWIQKAPLDFLRNLGRKTVAAASSHELKRNQDLYEARESSNVLRILLWRAGPFGFPFGILGPLAVIGILGTLGLLGRAWRHPSLTPLAGLVLVYGAGIVLFLPAARYRLPLVPFLIILAMWAAQGLWTHLWAHRREPHEASARTLRWRPLLALVGGIVLCNGGWARAVDNPSEQRYLRGTALVELERLTEAREQFEAAVELDPSDAESWTNLAALRGAAGDAPGALAASRRAVEADPGQARGQWNLGLAEQAAGQPQRARDAWRAAVALDPDLYPARVALTRSLASADSLPAARRVLDGAASVPPGESVAHFLLQGSLAARLGEWAQAAGAFREATHLAPENGDAWNNLGVALGRSGDTPRAVETLREGLRHAPGHPRLRANLAQWEQQLRIEAALPSETGNGSTAPSGHP